MRLAEVMDETGDRPGEVGRADMLDNLASIGARVLYAAEPVDDSPPVDALVAAINGLPMRPFDAGDTERVVAHLADVLRRERLALVLDSFDEAQGDYWNELGRR